MSHYHEEWDALRMRPLEALKYRTAEGLYDMKEAMEAMEDMKVGTKCDRNKPISTTDNDPVSSPNHYLKLGYECIEIIACSLSKEAFKGYCMGNFLKYRFRMGDKGEMQQDFSKSKEYLMLYDKYSHLCKDIPF